MRRPIKMQDGRNPPENISGVVPDLGRIVSTSESRDRGMPFSPTSFESKTRPNQGGGNVADPQILKKMKDFAGDKTVSQYVSEDLKQKQKRLEAGLQYHQEMSRINNIMTESKKQSQLKNELNSPYLPSYLQGKNVFDKSNH